MNVILIVADTWRRDHFGCYGNDWIHTPSVDALAAMGSVFDNARFGSYPTLPCRNDILTGRYEFPWRGWGNLTDGDYVLHRGIGTDETMLFHLPSDPDEDTNLADAQPAQLERMQGLLAAKLKEIDAPAELVAKLGS